MKVYQTHQIRNVALAGHSGAGKTLLTEAMLHIHGLVDRKGSVEDGSTQSDYDPEEKKRQTTINSTVLPIELAENKINLIDCPGYRDFVGEIENAVRIAEMCLIVIDAEAGVEVGTEFAWQYAQDYNIPIAIVVNKMDKERADFDSVMQQIDESFSAHTIPVTLPIGSGESFKGVVDLLDMKAVYDAGGKKKLEDVPEELKEKAEEARRALVEAAAEGDDELTEKFLEEETLSESEVRKGLREDLQEGRFIPVVCTSAEKEIGLAGLVHFIIDEGPSPDQRAGFRVYKDPENPEAGEELKKLAPDDPFSAFVFKTVNDDYAGRLSLFKVITGEVVGDCQIKNYNTEETMKTGHVFALRGKAQVSVDKLATGDIGAFAKLGDVETGQTLGDPKGRLYRCVPTQLLAPTVQVAIRAKNKSEEDRISMAIHRLLDADPTLKLERDPLLHQTVLHGMGDTHLDVALERLKTQARTEIDVRPPKVQYRETITSTATAQGKYKKQSGGRGQYGDCHIRFEPLERGSGFEFEWAIVGGVIPSNFKGSVEKGLLEALDKGYLAGYPMVDMKAVCHDGSYHSVDSSDMAFQVAASMAFKNAMAKADPVILEPIMQVTVLVPSEYMGDVMGYVSSHRGRISGNEQEGPKVRIVADVAQGEMANFSRDLRSMTQGRSIFESKFSHYEPCPANVQEKVIEESRAEHEKEAS